tara:strand:- start:216 stop:575 length:360 start_codon:yes stop_codon:yes gene_type:complete
MKYLLLLLCSLSLQSEWKDWKEKEQKLFKNLVVLNLIDTHMTYKTIQDFDAVEINPFLGTEPSLEKLMLHKIISMGTLYYVLDKDTSKIRQRDLKIINTAYISVLIHNGYIGFDLRKDF